MSSFRKVVWTLATLVLFAALGYGQGTSINAYNSDTIIRVDGVRYPTVQAAINALPSSGGTVVIPSGTYAGPTSIPVYSNTAIVCEAWMACRLQYTSNITFGSNGGLANYYQHLRLWGLVFDFQGRSAGLILNDVLYSSFSITVENSAGSALTVLGSCATLGKPETCTNHPWPSSASAMNDFEYVHIDNSSEGLVLNGNDNLACGGSQAIGGAAFFNIFKWLEITNNYGPDAINFTSGADSNVFHHVYMQLTGRATNGIVLGSRCPTSYGDIDLEHFEYVSTDRPSTWTGYQIVANFSRAVIEDLMTTSTGSQAVFNNGHGDLRIGSVSGSLLGGNSNPGFLQSGDANFVTPTLATPSANQFSPTIRFCGSEWSSTATSSQTCYSAQFRSSGSGVPTYDGLFFLPPTGSQTRNNLVSIPNKLVIQGPAASGNGSLTYTSTCNGKSIPCPVLAIDVIPGTTNGHVQESTTANVLTFPAGLGAISQVVGPSDQALQVGTQNNQNMKLIPNGTGLVEASSGLAAIGSAPTLSGTGACASISTELGGSWAGSLKCTGSTGASTVTITPGVTAPNGWSCSSSDVTAGEAGAQSASSTAACTVKFSSVTSGDVLTFTAVAF